MAQLYGITGMPLSGKTTAAQILEDNGFTLLDMGDVVRQEMKQRDIEPGNEGRFVNNQRDEHGMDAIAKLSIPYLQDILKKTNKVVITGMRGWSEKERFENEVGQDLNVIALWASPDTRRKRRESRQRDEDIKGQTFHERDLREINNGVGKLMALSDHMINNDNISRKELKERLLEVTN